MRHVREGELRVLRQKELLREVEAMRLYDAAGRARELLGVLTDALNAMRVHLAIEQRFHGRR